MIKTIEAVYDGHVFHPSHPLDLEADTQVRITFEPVQEELLNPSKENTSFIDTLLSVKIEDAPPDWSVNHDHYLYGVDKRE